MNLKLEGKHALVTGSTAGIGKGIAKSLLQEGAIVFVNGRDQQTLNNVTEELSDFGTCLPAPGDISTENGASQVIEAVSAKGPLDILVNNLGFYKGAAFTEITDEEWQLMFNVNVLSGVRMCRRFLPEMLKRNSGRVVMVSSECGIKPIVDFVHYCVAKTAVIGLGRALAEMTKGTDVTVNTILPGLTWTDNTAVYQTERARKEGKTVEQAMKEYFVTYEPNSLLQRATTVEEIASMVTYLCSELSAATNGAAVRAEGGLIRSI